MKRGGMPLIDRYGQDEHVRGAGHDDASRGDPDDPGRRGGRAHLVAGRRIEVPNVCQPDQSGAEPVKVPEEGGSVAPPGAATDRRPCRPSGASAPEVVPEDRDGRLQLQVPLPPQAAGQLQAWPLQHVQSRPQHTPSPQQTANLSREQDAPAGALVQLVVEVAG